MTRHKTHGLHKSIDEIFSNSPSAPEKEGDPLELSSHENADTPYVDIDSSDPEPFYDLLDAYNEIFDSFTNAEAPGKPANSESTLTESEPSEKTSKPSPQPFTMERFMAEPEEDRTPEESCGEDSVDQAILDTVNRLTKDVQCEKRFTCIESGLKDLCKAQLILNGRLLRCLETKKHKCNARSRFLGYYLCTCKIRFYLAKNLRTKPPAPELP